jgi:hypothetical protein
MCKSINGTCVSDIVGGASSPTYVNGEFVGRSIQDANDTLRNIGSGSLHRSAEELSLVRMVGVVVEQRGTETIRSSRLGQTQGRDQRCLE